MADDEFTHLHRHLTVVHLYFACEEVGTDCGLVAGAEPLVDLDIVGTAQSATVVLALQRCREMRTYWFIKLVLPTPLSPRMITWMLHCQPSPSIVGAVVYRIGQLEPSKEPFSSRPS